MLIILTICHVLNGSCKEVQVSAPDASANPAFCLREAQAPLAQYMAQYPNYRVARARCMSEEAFSHLEKHS